MRYAIVENGKVANIVESSSEFASGKGWIDATGAKKGDLYDAETGQFTTPVPAVVVPKRVTALQGMLALEQFGLDEAFETWASDPARTFKERAFLDKADHWRRSSEVIEAARVDMGLTEQQVDDMFIAAAQIDP